MVQHGISEMRETVTKVLSMGARMPRVTVTVCVCVCMCVPVCVCVCVRVYVCERERPWGLCREANDICLGDIFSAYHYLQSWRIRTANPARQLENTPLPSHQEAKYADLSALIYLWHQQKAINLSHLINLIQNSCCTPSAGAASGAETDTWSAHLGPNF